MTLSVSILILLLIVIIVVVNGVNNMRPEIALNNFSKQIENGDINDITLTIYCSYIFAHFPLSVKDLINHPATIKVDVDGVQLADHIDLLKQLNNIDLIPVKHKSRIDASIYYIFEDKKGRKIFDVAMWGNGDNGDSIYIEGKEFKANNIFMEIIMPFLPKV